MQLSSDEENQNSLFQEPNNAMSFDETANSLNNEISELDMKVYADISDNILTFIRSQLEIKYHDFKLDSLQTDKDIFNEQQIEYHGPTPNLYFLSRTILLKQSKALNPIRQKLIQKYKQYGIIKTNQKQEIDFQIHNESELINYKIRNLYIHLERQHRFLFCLDGDLLISKLYQYYSNVYQVFNFKEVGGLLLYWAYRKKILDESYLSESVIKLITIAIVLNMPLQADNIIPLYYKDNQKTFELLSHMVTIDKKGQCKLKQQLFSFQNFTIREKKGFFLMGKRKPMKIKQICPIKFPLTTDQYKKYKKKPQIAKKIKQQPKLSYAQIIFRIFKILNDDFNRNSAIIIDFNKYKLGWGTQISEKASLAVIHPVFGHNLTKQLMGSETNWRRVKIQIKRAYETLQMCKCSDPFKGVATLLSQK